MKYTFIVLALLFWFNGANAETCTYNDLGDRTCTTSTAGTTTGNVLNNSTFGTSGYSTQDWTISGDVGHGHGSTSGSTYTGQNTSGGTLAFEGDPNSSIYQDVDLVGDGHLTQSQINEGFTSTMSADVWFWNSTQNTFTLKQTITTPDGTVTTQVRNINDTNAGRPTNGGQWTNYTDSYTHNSNTETDFTIRAELYNDTAGTAYDGMHRGPDVDNVQLSITTAGANSTTVTPCSELGTCSGAGTAINDAVNLTTDSGMDLFEDLDTKVDDAFKEVEKIDDVKVEEIKFTAVIEDDLGEIEEVKFEEFVEMQFTSFIEENNLVEDFKEELKVEGLTEEEFFDELGGAMKEELGGEIMADMEQFKEEEMPDDITTETPTEEIKEEKFNEENTEEGELNATETSEKTETEEIVQSNEEEDTARPEDKTVSNESEMDTDTETEGQAKKEDSGETVEDTTDVSVKDRKLDAKVSSITEKVARVIKKLEEKLKRVDDKLKATSYVLAVGLQSTQPDLTSYNKEIYKNKNLSYQVPDGFFDMINILEQQQIYTDVSLQAYTSKDPIAVRQSQLNEINNRRNKLKAELSALRSLQ